MTERLQKKIRPAKKTLSELLSDKSVLTGREVVQHIKDDESDNPTDENEGIRL